MLGCNGRIKLPYLSKNKHWWSMQMSVTVRGPVKYCKNNKHYHLMQIFLPFPWPSAQHVTCKQYPQIMVCSCAMSPNCVWLQIIFCSCISETMLFSFLRSLLHGNDSFPKIFIKKTKLVNEWEDNYWTLLSQFIVICHCLICLPLKNYSILLNLVQ